MNKYLTACSLFVGLCVCAPLAWSGEQLINRVEYRFVCVKGKVKLQVKAAGQDWTRIGNQCGDEECRSEAACSSPEGKEQLAGRSRFERLTVDIACYNGKPQWRRIDASGSFRLQPYQGKGAFACDPKDNHQFSAEYFSDPDAPPARMNATRVAEGQGNSGLHEDARKAEYLAQAVSGRSGLEKEVIAETFTKTLTGWCLEPYKSECKSFVARAYRQPQSKENRANNATSWVVMISFLAKRPEGKWTLQAMCAKWEKSPTGYTGGNEASLLRNGQLYCNGVEYDAETLLPLK